MSDIDPDKTFARFRRAEVSDFARAARNVGAIDLATASQRDPRVSTRRRTRLRSAKVLDPANRFLCEALIQDRSASGMRLLLARNVGPLGRFGVYDDETGEVYFVGAVWRRDRAMGVRILALAPSLKPSQRHALRGRYYGVPD